MLSKPLLNYEEYFYCGTLELNNAHQSFAKLHGHRMCTQE